MAGHGCRALERLPRDEPCRCRHRHKPEQARTSYVAVASLALACLINEHSSPVAMPTPTRGYCCNRTTLSPHVPLHTRHGPHAAAKLKLTKHQSREAPSHARRRSQRQKGHRPPFPT